MTGRQTSKEENIKNTVRSRSRFEMGQYNDDDDDDDMMMMMMR
ncbi:uncharacterized protein ARB_04552 [Trichophyton benhamiae CBS 112371]|uniref:Uncharacterized protein n=1 Tax=Arthroderma benhamiae (strain ATCC MYA-4681 / CBS 112371) TaxID=663331 RepID=D4AJV2_ARTBC|nr:uncharacterized protein ARB_04552 [Trichophyton benhamiae CBS 112371]EFE37025.1 hypothetical protein ARB_04552 [Trichophyton benhamiae CBS 112371]